MNKQVTDYVNNLNLDWQRSICQRLRDIILQAAPDIEERLQYKKPHYLIDGKYAFVVGTAKEWVSMTIFNTLDLDTPDGLFEASENGERKTIKIHEGQTVDYEILARLVEQAAA
ncbi:MAG: DUF1801 domain-containing protein [Chloroflexi bacterium]|nr:DUF1801 domain-containing protein [Chloroflexota bacterium]